MSEPIEIREGTSSRYLYKGGRYICEQRKMNVAHIDAEDLHYMRMFAAAPEMYELLRSIGILLQSQQDTPPPGFKKYISGERKSYIRQIAEIKAKVDGDDE